MIDGVKTYGSTELIEKLQEAYKTLKDYFEIE